MQRPGILAALVTGCLLVAGSIVSHGFASDDSALNWHIFLQLLLPLIITAVLVGGVLCVSAASLQIVLRNPLADPGIIGITSGASLIAALLLLVPGITGSLPVYYLLPAGCFLGALLSTWAIYRISVRFYGATTAVVLSGIAISTLSGAIIAWLYLFSDAQSLRNLTFWLMGSLYQSDWLILMISGPLMLLSIAVQCFHARRLNQLYGGEVAAFSAGTDPHQLTMRCLLAAAVGVGAAVAVAGSIAFLGLLVPHLLRLWFGYDNRFILPASALAGALVLLTIVLITELSSAISLPVSMLTASIGGPILLITLYRGQWRL